MSVCTKVSASVCSGRRVCTRVSVHRTGCGNIPGNKTLQGGSQLVCGLSMQCLHQLMCVNTWPSADGTAFGKVVEARWMEGIGHWGWALTFYWPASLPDCSLLGVAGAGMPSAMTYELKPFQQEPKQALS